MDVALTLEVTDGRVIQLCRADLSDLHPAEGVDLLVVSAFRDDYWPTPNSVIGALDRRGLSVGDLAADKEADLRASSSCWVSREIDREVAGFSRLLCYEPATPADAPTAVGDVFRAIVPYVDVNRGVRTVAMPILGTGDMRRSIEEMLTPLLDAAINWMSRSLPLERLIIGVRHEEALAAAQAVMGERTVAPAVDERSEPARTHDLFVSYARADGSEAAEAFVKAVRELKHDVQVFLDRQAIDPGMSWQSEIYRSLESCQRVVAIVTAGYLDSKMCREELNLALLRRREEDESILFPIYLTSVSQLPIEVRAYHFADCREADEGRLRDAAAEMLRSFPPAQ